MDLFRFDLGDGADLRLLELHHASELYAFVEANRAYLSEWLNWVREINNLQDIQKFLHEGMGYFARDGLPTVGIWRDGAMAGGIGFFATDAHLRATEVGYWLGTSAAGRGLMTRSLRVLLDYMFDKVSMNRVTLSAELANTRSRAVADRVGFTFEGIRRDGWANDGKFVDLAVYSMLARDWKVLRNP